MTQKNKAGIYKITCAKEAEKAYGVTNSMILKCCKGVHKRGGKLPDGTPLVWEYAERRERCR